jgi:hypothetical protein
MNALGNKYDLAALKEKWATLAGEVALLRRAGKPVTAPEIVPGATQGDSRRALTPVSGGTLSICKGRKIVVKERNGTGATWVLT